MAYSNLGYFFTSKSSLPQIPHMTLFLDAQVGRSSEVTHLPRNPGHMIHTQEWKMEIWSSIYININPGELTQAPNPRNWCVEPWSSWNPNETGE